MTIKVCLRLSAIQLLLNIILSGSPYITIIDILCVFTHVNNVKHRDFAFTFMIKVYNY